AQAAEDPNERVEEDAEIDIVCIIRNPSKVKIKGRPPGAPNKRTVSQANLNNSTRREPSRFEYAEAEEQAVDFGSGTEV
ncbi:hypothetical protein MMC29_003728, partial [Sticta canariensis]|nr:hypothetical protein [Sticta canariensis]